MRLKDKVAIVTGAAGGQGRATVELFAREGALVYAADIEAGTYECTNVHQVKLDIRDEDAWKSLVAQVVREGGNLDILVNNAAIIGNGGSFETTTLADWNKVLETNLTGAFLGMRTVIPVMRDAGRGSIVNILSIVAKSPGPFVLAYHAAKGGLHTITQHAAMLHAADGVRVNSVYPGVIATPMMGAAATNDRMAEAFRKGIPMGRIGHPDEIAFANLFLASDEASYVTGAEIIVDGGATIQTALAAQQSAAAGL